MEQLTLSEYQQRKEIIRQQLSQTVESFLIIGHQLREIEETQSYKLEGYASLSDMAKAEFNLRRDTVSRFMDISAKLTVDGNGVELLPELKGLTYSKLQDVLTLPVTDYELLTPQSKVSEIRELKAFNKADATKEILDARNAPAEETVLSPLRRCIRDFFKEPDNRPLLNHIMNTIALPEYEEPESYDRQICEEMNPAGSRTHKKGLIYLFMYSYETGIKYKKMGKPLPDKMTWHEFIAEIAGTFAGYRDETGETWNNAFGEGNVFGKDREETNQPELPGQINLEDIRQEQEEIMPEAEEANQEAKKQETAVRESQEETQQEAEAGAPQEETLLGANVQVSKGEEIPTAELQGKHPEKEASKDQHQEKDKAKIATSQQKRKASDPREGMTPEELAILDTLVQRLVREIPKVYELEAVPAIANAILQAKEYPDMIVGESRMKIITDQVGTIAVTGLEKETGRCIGLRLGAAFLAGEIKKYITAHPQGQPVHSSAFTFPEPASSQAAEDDQLPGQMDVSDYPGVVVEAEYRELPAGSEYSGTEIEGAENGTGYAEIGTERTESSIDSAETGTKHTESSQEASRQQDTPGKVLFKPEVLSQEQNIRFVPTRETVSDQSAPFTAMNPPTPATEEERTALLQSAWNEARLASGTVNTLMQSTFLATLTRETADLILQNAGRLITNLSYICGELYQWEPSPSAPDLEAD